MKENSNTWFKIEDDHLPPLKLLAIISFVLMLLGTAMFPIQGKIPEYIREYIGLVWHLSMFFFINKLPAPEWGKKAGTYWVVLDVLSGMLYINNLYNIKADTTLGIATFSGFTLCYAIRLAAHIFLGIWLISTARTTDNKVIKLCGILAGILLGGYSLLSPFVPTWVLTLNGPFMIVFYFMIVIGKYKKPN